MSKPRIVVLMGGPDAERNISIASGTAIANALKKNHEFQTSLELIKTPTVKDLSEMQADVFFPALHGPFGEGGELQRLLEKTSVPFVGSNSIVAANAMDKITSKEVAQDYGIPTPQWQVVNDADNINLQTPLVLKPIDDGSSFDIYICQHDRELREPLQKLLKQRKSVLAESYKNGREITVGIVDREVLPTIEIIPESGNYDFAAKYERDDTKYIINPPLRDELCVEWSVKIVEAMNIRDLARVDFIVDDEGPWFLEVNTMPGFTDHSLLPKAAAHVGWDMTTLCSKLVKCALTRESKIEF